MPLAAPFWPRRSTVFCRFLTPFWRWIPDFSKGCAGFTAKEKFPDPLSFRPTRKARATLRTRIPRISGLVEKMHDFGVRRGPAKPSAPAPALTGFARANASTEKQNAVVPPLRHSSGDSREVGNRVGGLAQFAEQAQPVEAQGGIVDVDRDVLEERVDRLAQRGERAHRLFDTSLPRRIRAPRRPPRPARRRASLPPAARARPDRGGRRRRRRRPSFPRP